MIPHPPPHGALLTVIGRDLALRDVLAEPGSRAKGWFASVYARVLVASAGPLVLADVAAAHPDLAARLRAARVETVAPDADLAAARAAFWPLLDRLADLDLGAGSPHPTLVIVGERPGQHGPRRPFLARSGRWLLDALRRLGHDELTLYLTNVYADAERGGPDQGAALAALRDAFLEGGAAPTWVGCGRAAQKVLRRAGVDHVPVVHPAYARRFRYKEGGRGYADALREAGVPEGPWLDRPPPRHAVKDGEEPDLAHPFGGLPRGLLTGREGKKRRRAEGGSRTGYDEGRAAKARRLYVYGEVTTFKAAAEAVDGLSYAQCCQAARDQDWRGQRARHEAEVEREVARRAMDEEVENVGKARRGAWKAARLGVESILERMETEGAEALSVQDVERLVKCAHVLAGHRDDEDWDEPETEAPTDETLVATFLEVAGLVRDRLGADVVARLVTGEV